MACAVDSAVTVDPGVRLAVLHERKYSLMKCVTVDIIAGGTAFEFCWMIARTCSLAAVNSGVKLEY